MKKEYMMNLAGVMFFYLLLVLGIIMLDARMEQINSVNNNISFIR